MKVAIKLTNRACFNKFKRDVEVEKIKRRYSYKYLNQKVLIRARDLYPDTYKSGKIFLVMFLKRKVEGGYVIGPDNGDNHLHRIETIYFYKE